jgi:DNA-binding winged helix-turn-helix (wHTH) protein
MTRQLAVSDSRDRHIASLTDQLDLALEELATLRKSLGLARDYELDYAFSRKWGLTSSEGRVLLLLFNAKGRVVSKDAIQDGLYFDRVEEPDIKIVDVFIHKIRVKIGPDRILTAWGRGYSLSVEGLAACQQLQDTPITDVARAVPLPRALKRAKTTTAKIFARLAEGPATSADISAVISRSVSHTASYLSAAHRRGLVRVVEEGVANGHGHRNANIWGLTEADRQHTAAL